MEARSMQEIAEQARAKLVDLTPEELLSLS
jgi:hypothetical protein